MVFKSTVAACLSILACLEAASATAIEPRACPANNLLRGLKDKRYSAQGAAWCLAYNNVPAVTSTVTADTETVTDVIPNPSTVSVTQTRTSTVTTTVFSRETAIQSGATTLPSPTWVEVRITTDRVWTTYTSTSTTTTTLRKTSEVVIPTGLSDIVAKYSPAAVSQACDCLDIPPNTTTQTVGASTATVTSSADVATITFRPLVTARETKVSTLFSYQSTVWSTTTYTETGASFTSTIWESKVATATKTECAYMQTPVMNPGFEDGDAGWTALIGGGNSWVSAELDNSTSHGDGSNSWKVQYRSVGTFLGVRQFLEDTCPTTWYTITAWIKAEQGSNCVVRFSSGRGYAGGEPLQVGWKQYTANVYTGPLQGSPDILSQVYVDCGYAGGVRNFWIDDVDVQKMEPQPPSPY